MAVADGRSGHRSGPGADRCRREAVIVLGLSGRGDKDLAALGLKEVGR